MGETGRTEDFFLERFTDSVEKNRALRETNAKYKAEQAAKAAKEAELKKSAEPTEPAESPAESPEATKAA